MFYKKKLLHKDFTFAQRFQIEISKAWTQLRDKAQVVEEVIKLLNGRTQYDLVAMGINDRTFIIMTTSEAHAKRDLILLAQNKLYSASLYGQCFKENFNP
jgi:hypothetical protein